MLLSIKSNYCPKNGNCMRRSHFVFFKIKTRPNIKEHLTSQYFYSRDLTFSIEQKQKYVFVV